MLQGAFSYWGSHCKYSTNKGKTYTLFKGGNPKKSHALSGDTCLSSPYMGVPPTQTLSSFDASPSDVYKDKYFQVI